MRAEEPNNLENAVSLQELNREIDLLLYAISHDLRAPLRAIDGFSEALLEDYTDVLDDMGKDFIKRIQKAGKLLGRYIDAALNVSRQTRGEMSLEDVDLSALAHQITEALINRQPERKVSFIIEDKINTFGDKRLLAILLETLFDNAWKFTSKNDVATIIEFNVREENGKNVFFLSDNGVGFDMEYANRRLFGLFQRMHSEDKFEGIGTGLATAKRIINRHGGRIWAESKVNEGSTFFFNL
ncbi:MAG: hypothetical protein HQK76_01290 [Desulfobacterales bacterium]|nr:hypothetical protein [Desulfobacterales bacterium]